MRVDNELVNDHWSLVNELKYLSHHFCWYPVQYSAPAKYQLHVIDLVSNGTSTQTGQFVPIAGEGNWLRWLRMANEIQYKYFTLHNNNVTQFTLKHSSYISTTTGYLIVWLTCLLLSSFAHTKPDSTHPIRYNFPRCEFSLMLCPAVDKEYTIDGGYC